MKNNVKENNSRHERALKNKVKTIEDRTAFKIAKTAEQKSLKKNQKKMEKKLKSFYGNEHKGELTELHLDLNMIN